MMYLQKFLHVTKSNVVQSNGRGRYGSYPCSRYFHGNKNHQRQHKAKATPKPATATPSTNSDASSSVDRTSLTTQSFALLDRCHLIIEKYKEKMKSTIPRLVLFALLSIPISIVSPFILQGMESPSMMPTVHPRGEIYIQITSWFYKLVMANQDDNIKLSSKHPWQVGDVVALMDFKGAQVCKRIVALEGDRVNILGQYRHLYKEEEEYGIRGREQMIDRGLPNKWREEITIHDERKNYDVEITIPKDHVWVEGDNPLHSMDSRFYGPIHKKQLLSKVVYRVWPRRRLDGNPCITSRERPHPISEEEMYGGMYNLEKNPYFK